MDFNKKSSQTNVSLSGSDRLNDKYAEYTNPTLKLQIEALIKQSGLTDTQKQKTISNFIYNTIIFLRTEIRYIDLAKNGDTDTDNWEDQRTVSNNFVKYFTVRNGCSGEFFDLVKTKTTILEKNISEGHWDWFESETKEFCNQLMKFASRKNNFLISYLSFLCCFIAGIVGFVFFPIVFLVSLYTEMRNFSAEKDKSRISLLIRMIGTLPLFFLAGPLITVRAVNKISIFHKVTETTNDSILAKYFLDNIAMDK